MHFDIHIILYHTHRQCRDPRVWLPLRYNFSDRIICHANKSYTLESYLLVPFLRQPYMPCCLQNHLRCVHHSPACDHDASCDDILHYSHLPCCLCNSNGLTASYDNAVPVWRRLRTQQRHLTASHANTMFFNYAGLPGSALYLEMIVCSKIYG